MRIIFAILGIAAIVVAGVAFKEAVTTGKNFYVTRMGGAALAVAGIAFLVAARKRYRGHWSFVIGVGLICCSILGLSSELDDLRAGKEKDFELGILLSLGLMTIGVLSLWSANKLHNYARAVEGKSADALVN